MKHIPFAAAFVLSCLAASAQAVVLDFDNPAQIAFNADGSQTLVENNYRFDGDIGSFVPQPDPADPTDGVLVGGTFGAGIPFSLRPTEGGLFTLLSLDYAAFDLGFGTPPGTFSVTGMRNGTTVAALTINLGAPTTVTFGNSFAQLTSVTFNASTAFSIDNVAVVPEPGSWALAAFGLGMLALGIRRTRKSAA